ncbi:MAG: PilT/PilU family type 4a pilus ATPase [Deltaproteobacteria bacterium]|jgi:twitching motility protein PilT|nr:PilT/PilU family type 4a pilus ATPase [Deltaproteobacteria bacterium]
MVKNTERNAARPTGRQRIGDSFVDSKLITKEQLRQALTKQTQAGGQLGSILLELGYIDIDDLLAFLSRQSGIETINLFKVDIEKSVLDLIPREKIFNAKILPVSADQTTLTLAMVNPNDYEIISELGFSLGKKIKPVMIPSFMMEAARKILLTDVMSSLKGDLVREMVENSWEKMSKAPPLISLLQYLAKSDASDMLLTPGAPPCIKINNEVKRMNMAPLTPDDCEKYAREFLSSEDWERFLGSNDIGFAVTYPSIGRFRANIFRQRGSIAIAIRNLPETIPSFSQLNLPDWLRDFCLKPRGLILIAGPAGHGKSTTLCALVDIINTNRRCNIVTLEDPVEYLHQHKMSNINQRQVGRDTRSFSEGLRNVFRQAPDVIVIGEMRDKESYEIAIKAASTGHLVLSTIHANNSTSVVESVINSFEPHEQNLARQMLADCLLLCLAQRLVPSRKRARRVLALEKLVNSHRIRKRIREEKTHHVRSQMQAGTEDFTSLDVSLANLCKKNAIQLEDGVLYAEDELFFREVASGAR